MKATFLKPVLFAAFAAGVLTSCVNDDDYGIPTLECVDQDITVTKTVQDILTQATTSAVQYSADDIIEAVVVSSDRGGNFYKTLYLNSLDGEIGFNVQVNQADLFSDYGVGRKVYIKLQGLYTQVRSNTLQIGALYNGNVGQIPTELYRDHIIRSCEVVDEETLVNHISVADVDDSYIGKLIEFDASQFTDASLNQTYYNAANVDAGGQTLTYITNSASETIKIPFRTSSFAEYAGMQVSPNSGKIRGILTKFNTTYQFVSRYSSDINLTEDRIENGGGNPGVSETAVGGTEIVFSGNFTEDFESFTPGSVINYGAEQSTYAKYVNDAVEGPRYWAITQFGGNKYIQMSAHNTNATAKTYFIVPVDFAGGATLSFKTKDGYNNGQVLKVYYSTNYTAGSVVAEATLVDITSNFTIANSAPSTGYASNFTASGAYNIPVTTGTGFVIFEYTGAHPAGPTTTMQLDDIVIN
ncbi:DUF5689 domain-containing protein [Flavobacterium sp. MFBS3-15]|uniref:DUF5689 domain-containing protein n=1 Tax=Flavobacterium sp. MFBS3-15 TaxID=2989816 RepID=UPI0022365B16|nr:DUF5689 domain-containing protein [Flavobacterium sp. MFBS3-15]MCW4470662.1 DUF5689 domain-containing protein [Flavobacterium sp. MFBS3-15]